MGSEFSSFIVAPVVGGGAAALAIVATTKENKKRGSGYPYGIGAVIATIILGLLILILGALG